MLKFVDGKRLFEVVRSVEGVDRIRKDLLKLCNWSPDWLMMFNVNKCKVTHTGKSNSNACCYVMGYNIGEG